jgi:hypothetical protein
VIYKALNSRGNHDDMLPTAELVCIFVKNENHIVYLSFLLLLA